jgi:hypothetical protein
MLRKNLLPPFQGRRKDVRYIKWKDRDRSFEKATGYSGPERGGAR